MKAQYVSCPFCNQEDFDLVGLKDHLNGRCEPFDDTLTPLEDRNMRRRLANPLSGEVNHG